MHAGGTPGLFANGSAPTVDFRGVYDKHFRMVYRALQCRGVRHADLMDMTQKVFMIAFRRLPEFEGRSTIATWLQGICRRVACGYRRSGVFKYEIATDPRDFIESCRALESAGADVAMVRQVELRRLLSKLTIEQQSTFVLVELDELNGREVASRLDVSVGTVRSRLRRARAKFRRETHRLEIGGSAMLR